MTRQLSDNEIRDIMLANGFTIKDGLTDLKPYVYDAARALLSAASDPRPVNQRDTGLYPKYAVNRLDGRDRPGEDRADAMYFVLDLVYDDYAPTAMAAYASAIDVERYPKFAAQMRQLYPLANTSIGAVLTAAIDAIETSTNGLKWYNDMYPVAQSSVDDEIIATNDSVIQQLQLLVNPPIHKEDLA